MKQKMDKSIVEKERNTRDTTRNTTLLSRSKHHCIPMVVVAKSFKLDDSYYPLVEMSWKRRISRDIFNIPHSRIYHYQY